MNDDILEDSAADVSINTDPIPGQSVTIHAQVAEGIGEVVETDGLD